MAAIIPADADPYALTPTDELRDALRSALNAVADKCMEAARIIHALERRGEDMAEVRRLVGWAFHVLRRMAAGDVSAEAFVKFAGSRALLQAVSGLPFGEQERLAGGAKVPLVGIGATRLVDPLELSRDEIRQVFAPDRVRTEEEQAEWRRSGAYLPPTPRAKQEKGQNKISLYNPGRVATPKDLASLIVEMLEANDQPAAAVRELLQHPGWKRLTRES